MRFIFFPAIFLGLFSCGSYNDSNEKSITYTTDSIIPKKFSDSSAINSKYPLGPLALSEIKYPKHWKGDSVNYGQLLPPEGKQFDEITEYFRNLNSGKTIGTIPELYNLNHIKLGVEYKSDGYFDTIAQQRVDSIKFRLPNIGKLHCYYSFHRANKRFGEYGNLLILDKDNKTGTTFNVYYEVGGDQTVQFRFFIFDGKVLRIFEGECYDDGCELRERFKIEIDTAGQIKITEK